MNPALAARPWVPGGAPWSGAFNEMAGAGADFTISIRPMRQEVHHLRAPASHNRDGRLALHRRHRSGHL
jgi:hypothetical protein